MAKVTIANAKITKSSEISLEDAAALTNLSKTWLLKLANEGYFKAERHGVYKLGNVIQGIIKYHKEERRNASQTAASAEVQKARARQINQRTALEAGELRRTSEFNATTDQIVGGIIAELNGLASRLTRDRTLRVEYDKVIHDMRQRLTDQWAALAKGETPEEDIAEDDE
jgi:hypothetical protein